MSKKLSKSAKKQIINIVVLVLLIGITFVVLFTSTDINLPAIGRFIADSHPGYMAAAFGGMLGFILFEAISLHIIARTLGHKSKITSSIAYSTSDLYYSAITPSASGGQPASAYYMMRDGMNGGTAGFTVLLNIIAYTIATIFVGLFGVIVAPGMFGQIGHWLAQVLVILGFVIQLLLLSVLLLCLFRASIILRIGGWGISLLTKMRIIKKPDKWRSRMKKMVKKYRSCRSVLKKHPMMFVNALLFNVCQRVSQTLIPCFVIMASPIFDGMGVSFLELFCMQAYVVIGYNSIPLPGGTGVYEYLYPNIFGIGFPDMTFVLSAMMVSRAISYYICMIVTGLYTLIYHAVGIKKIKEKDGGMTPERAAKLQSLAEDNDIIATAVLEGDPNNNADIELKPLNIKPIRRKRRKPDEPTDKPPEAEPTAVEQTEQPEQSAQEQEAEPEPEPTVAEQPEQSTEETPKQPDSPEGDADASEIPTEETNNE